MPIRNQNDALKYGMSIVRTYDDQAGSIDAQCGSLAYYNNILDSLVKNNAEYYNQGDGTNKFLKHVQPLRISAYPLDYPTDAANFLGARSEAFCCFNDGNDYSHIQARYLDPALNSSATDFHARNAYRYPASLSHEFGHAHHNWCGFPADNTWGAEIRDFFTKQFLKPGKVWPQGYNLWETYANVYRCLKGVQETRGVADTPPELEDPTVHPEWRKQLDLLPELCAFMRAYGVKPGTLSWHGDESTGYWQFQRGTDGTWVAQTAPYGWEEWVRPNWWSSESWYWYNPTYSRS